MKKRPLKSAPPEKVPVTDSAAAGSGGSIKSSSSNGYAGYMDSHMYLHLDQTLTTVGAHGATSKKKLNATFGVPRGAGTIDAKLEGN